MAVKYSIPSLMLLSKSFQRRQNFSVAMALLFVPQSPIRKSAMYRNGYTRYFPEQKLFISYCVQQSFIMLPYCTCGRTGYRYQFYNCNFRYSIHFFNDKMTRSVADPVGSEPFRRIRIRIRSTVNQISYR